MDALTEVSCGGLRSRLDAERTSRRRFCGGRIGGDGVVVAFVVDLTIGISLIGSCGGGVGGGGGFVLVTLFEAIVVFVVFLLTAFLVLIVVVVETTFASFLF